MVLSGLSSEFALLSTVADSQVAVAHDERIASINVFRLDEFSLCKPLVGVTNKSDVLAV